MQPAGKRVYLSVGHQRGLVGRYLLVLVFGGAVAIVAVIAGFRLGGLLVRTVGEGVDPLNAGPFSLPFLTGGLFGIGTWFLLRLAIRRVFSGAWLDGTRLTVQDGRRQAVELTTARAISLQASAERLATSAPAGVLGAPPTVPLLVVDANGRQIRLRLASRDRVLLPPDQLLTLANVLSFARCPGVAEIVGWLRAMAAWPR
ncbi:hypothetical protein [Plantactinospora sp. WMMB782]|uniref:hypothetical protein n=1 Tax=Plantactinospora sp. WMMB782 TaxID=3404121 RepID=UPI003B95EF16